MADSTKYYVLRGDKALAESLTKEQILAAIIQAVETHEISDVDTGFVEKIKEQKSGSNLMFWVGTTAEYNAIATKQNNCFYILTDDQEKEQIELLVETLSNQVEEMREKIAGETIWNGTPVQSGETAPTEIDLNADDFLRYRLYAITIASDANGTDSTLILAYRHRSQDTETAYATIFSDITESTHETGTLVHTSYDVELLSYLDKVYFSGSKVSINLSTGYKAYDQYYLISIIGVI